MTLTKLFLVIGLSLLCNATIAHYLIHHHFTVSWENYT